MCNNVLRELSAEEKEQIGKCAEQNAQGCQFELGFLCQSCSVWLTKEVPCNCPWVQKA